MKIQKKINHDSLWLKVVDGKNWAKLYIGRNVTKVTTRGEMKTVVDTMISRYKQAMSEGKSFGDAIDYVESGFTVSPA